VASAYNHRPQLLARARRIVVDRHLAEEAVQEAYLRAWRACATFDPDGSPLVNWLLAITGNVAIDLVRARTRRLPQTATTPDENVSSSGPTEIDRLLVRAQLSDALAALSAQHRHAIVEVIVRDRPYVDVAAEVGVNPATLRTRVHYALRRLRDAWRQADVPT